MFRKMLLAVALLSSVSAALAADTGHSKATLSATEIADQNIQARGGLQAWRAVQSLSFEGKIGAGGNRQAPVPASLPVKGSDKNSVLSPLTEEAQLPFKMLMKRPRQVRFDIEFKGQTAVQVYDGVHGWKSRPYLNRNGVELFTAEEMKAASLQPELDGPLIDYAAKGPRVELVGMEGGNAYNLKLTTKSGEATHVWIDAQTFLEAKVEGQPRRLDGKDHPVEVYYRDYRAVNGLQIPFVLETKVLPLADSAKGPREASVPAERITIQKVIVNPKLVASSFSMPEVQTATNGH
jgi:hypothetical protein